MKTNQYLQPPVLSLLHLLPLLIPILWHGLGSCSNGEPDQDDSVRTSRINLVYGNPLVVKATVTDKANVTQIRLDKPLAEKETEFLTLELEIEEVFFSTLSTRMLDGRFGKNFSPFTTIVLFDGDDVDLAQVRDGLMILHHDTFLGALFFDPVDQFDSAEDVRDSLNHRFKIMAKWNLELESRKKE